MMKEIFICRIISDPLAAAGLTRERLAEISQYANPEVRAQKVTASLLLEYAFKSVGAARAERFETGKFGKPYVADDGGASPRFNLSHSSEYAAAALCGTEIGIDIEQIDRGSAAIAPKIFKPYELPFFYIQPEEKQQREAAKRWTVCESYLKFTGEGLRGLSRLPEFFPAETCVTAEYDGSIVYIHTAEHDGHFISTASYSEEAPVIRHVRLGAGD